MSYTPKTWTTGDTIDASSLNHIEQGIVSAESSGGGVFHITDNVGTLDKTWNEIAEAIASGQIAYIATAQWEDGAVESAWCDIVRNVTPDDGTYYIYLLGYDDSMGYTASSASGYPVFFD